MRDEKVAQLQSMVQHLQQENSILLSVQQPDSEADDTTSLSTKTIVDNTHAHNNNNDNGDLPEEECWLFKAPVKVTNTSFLSNVSCMQWAREVYDSPASSLAVRRKDLLNRLEAIISTSTVQQLPSAFGGSVPSLHSMPMEAQVMTEKKIPGVTSAGNFRSQINLQQPPNPSNMATFTRPRRPTYNAQPPQSQQQQQQQQQSCQPPNHGSNSDTNIAAPGSLRSRSPTVRSSGSNDDLHNVADLKNLVKMQEEDLKAQVAAMAGRYGSQSSLNSSSLHGAGSSPGSPYSSTNRLNVHPSSPSHLNSPLSIAKMQEDDLKAEVAAMSAAAHNRMGSQQSLSSPSQGPNSGPDSPYSSNNRLNFTSPMPNQQSLLPPQQQKQPTPMHRLRYSLDSYQQRNGDRGGMFDENEGEESAWGKPSPPLGVSSVNLLRYSPDHQNNNSHLAYPNLKYAAAPANFGDSSQQAVIVGKSNKVQRHFSVGSRIPSTSSKIASLRRSPKSLNPQMHFNNNNQHPISPGPVADTILPSYGWGETAGHPTIQPPPDLPRRIPPLPVRRGSELS